MLTHDQTSCSFEDILNFMLLYNVAGKYIIIYYLMSIIDSVNLASSRWSDTELCYDCRVAWMWSCFNRLFTKDRLRGTGHCKFSLESCHCWLQLAQQFQVAIGSCQDIETQIIHFTVYIEKEPAHFFSIQPAVQAAKPFHEDTCSVAS